MSRTLVILNSVVGLSAAFHLYVTLGFFYPAIGLRRIGRKKYHPVITRWIGYHRPTLALLSFDCLVFIWTYVVALRESVSLGPAWLLPLHHDLGDRCPLPAHR